MHLDLTPLTRVQRWTAHSTQQHATVPPHPLSPVEVRSRGRTGKSQARLFQLRVGASSARAPAARSALRRYKQSGEEP